MYIYPEDRAGLLKAARGERPLDLIIRGAEMVNLFTNEIYTADIGIYDGFIAHISCDPDGSGGTGVLQEAREEYDAQGLYLVPGFIDSHIHIESTMMTPRNFAEAVVPWGTTTVVMDPHEIANVWGREGVVYMHDAGEGLPMRQLLMVPSCVPAVPGLESAGASFEAPDILSLLKLERAVGIAEVMDFPGVIANHPRMEAILRGGLENDTFIQGHAPLLRGRALSAYLCAGPVSDHESRTPGEAREKLRSGMFVDARESSISQDIGAVLEGAAGFGSLSRLTLCTDDREPGDILREGHMNYVVQTAIERGMDPLQAIRSASLNAAQEIGLRNTGAVAPGWTADLVLLPSLERIVPEAVFFGGRLAAQQGRLVRPVEGVSFPLEEQNSVHTGDLKPTDFYIQARDRRGAVKTRVIEFDAVNWTATRISVEELDVSEDRIDISGRPDLAYALVVNRHREHGSSFCGLVKGFGLRQGALGSTVSHDCHNLTLVYRNPEDAIQLARTLADSGGGIGAVAGGELLSLLALPVAGLMSREPCSVLAEASRDLKKGLAAIGLSGEKSLLKIATLALPVIPEVRITDRGLVDVIRQEFLDLFP